MRLDRRRALAVGLAAVLLVAAVAAALVLVRDDDHGPRLPGRIAVRTGCGLTHMWQDGTDQRELCLSNIWAAASLSFDGRRLAWDTNAASTFGIVVAAPDGEDEKVLPLPAGVNTEPTLSPDAKEVAFLHSPADDGRYDLWSTSTSAASDVAEQVTSTRNVSTPAWSPTGERIAYVRGWSDETLEGRIVLVRPDGGDERVLATGDVPSWAPSGDELVFVHGGNIWTMKADGSEKRLLVENGGLPAWSRDGTQIAFLRPEKCGKPLCKERVFLVSSNGGDPRPIGPGFADASELLWLPDPNE